MPEVQKNKKLYTNCDSDKKYIYGRCWGSIGETSGQIKLTFSVVVKKNLT